MTIKNHILQINIIYKIEVVTGRIQIKLKLENKKWKSSKKTKKKGLCNQCDRGEIMRNSIFYTLVAEMHEHKNDVSSNFQKLQTTSIHKERK